jgi:hypothetical protein
MATVNSTAIFPSIKYIATDDLGDLQEVVGSYATNASKTHDGLTFTSVESGEAGNLISIAIVEDENASGLSFDVTGEAITLIAESAPGVPEVPAVAASITQEGVTYTADTAGASGNSITLEIKQGQSGAGVVGIEFSATGNAILMATELALDNYTQGDVQTAFATAPTAVTDLVDISVADSGAFLTNGGTLSPTNLSGGSDLIPAVPAVTIASYTQGQVQTAFAGAGSAVTDLVTLSIADGSTNLVSTLTDTNLTGGAEAQGGSLDASSKYILIKQSELHDLADDETDDGRKLLWGIVHKASEIFAGLSDPPANFTVVKGNPVAVDNGTALRQTYTVQATYALTGLDLKGEA